MASRWRFQQTRGAPALVRDCDEDAVLPIPDVPAVDVCDAMLSIDAYSLGLYAEDLPGALLAQAIEIHASVSDLGSFGAVRKMVKHSTRPALVSGPLRLANGRVEQAFAGGKPRFLEHYRYWRRGELPRPVQLDRLDELEEAGVDGVEFPTNPAVDMKYGLRVGQPIVICQRRFRAAVKEGRVKVVWLPY